MLTIPAPIAPPPRILMGPGPSDVAPSVLTAMAQPTLGHLDPYFLEIMDQIRDMLRALLGTENSLTMPMSGTGSAGMETCLVNLIEPGDRVLIGSNGVFGGRMAEVSRRAGAAVVVVERPWGEPLTPADFAEAEGDFKLIALVHAETSTGALSDLSGFRALADERDALLVVDAVTSLGGVPVEMDRHGIDALYSGSQKCLSCPPGLSPVSFSPRAVAVLQSRLTPVQSWYLDLNLIARYWGGERAYHHTAPVNLLYGLHEALRLALVEGAAARHDRHARNGTALVAGLEAMGLELPVAPAARMPQLTVVSVPNGVDEAAVRRHLLAAHRLEIGGGLGAAKGKVWRVGLMGAAATRENVTCFLSALDEVLRAAGYTPTADPIRAAEACWR
ncbi:MAG: alanine--glyoxylate aminotransferase family protein [Myxococcota bacterium]|nr:alanine--glyoxylate aminotransferase family protein [Myxococcota bacterium]